MLKTLNRFSPTAWLLLAVAIAPLSADEAQKLKFAGCSISAVAYMKDMAKAYEKKTGIPVEVKGGGVPMGIAATTSGKVDLSGSCRHMLKREIESGAVPTVVGYDMLMVIVHPENPVESLTIEQVRRIFSGKLANWKQAGGPDKGIVLVGREVDDAGVAVMFKEMVMKDLPMSENRLNLLSSSEIEQEMEGNKYGIAVTGISALTRKVKVLKINGTAASRENFRNGGYPLVRPLYLVTKGRPSGPTKNFIEFVLSEEGQIVMAKNAIPIADFRFRQSQAGASAR